MLTLGVIVFLLTVILVPLVGAVLKRQGILDKPDRAQISHDEPTPRGGGLAVMPIIFLAWGGLIYFRVYNWPDARLCYVVLLCGILLCAFTWIDDHLPGGLRVRTRLAMQLLAVSIPLFFWPSDAGRLLPEFFPLFVERILMALAWLWFANLYNFMDGINGITGAETVSISGGLMLFCFFAPVVVPPGYIAMLVVPLAAALGFIVWNARPVARIFIGDVGSVGLGYCLAWLLFIFAASGYLMPAVLISLVYSLDASFTLIKRAWQRKQIWQAHREHYYHRATVKGALTHLQCVAIIVAVNALLIGIGFACLYGVIQPVTGFVTGLFVVICLLALFYYIGFINGHVSSPRPEAFSIERKIRQFLQRKAAP